MRDNRQVNWEQCDIPANAMCQLSPELVAILCAKHKVPYLDYKILAGRVGRLTNIDMTFCGENAYNYYSTKGVQGGIIPDTTRLFWLTRRQFIQFCEYVHKHSTCGSKWKTQQMVSFYAYCFPKLIAPCNYNVVYSERNL